MIPRPGLRMKTLKSGSWAMTSRPHSPLRQSTNTIVGSCWHSVYTNILCLAVSGMLSWEGLHITSSLQILPLLSTNIVPWRQRYRERNLHVYKAWHYFVKMLSGVCTLNMLKGRVEINRTEQNQTMLMVCKTTILHMMVWKTKGMFSLCSDVLPNIIGRAKDLLTLFLYL